MKYDRLYYRLNSPNFFLLRPLLKEYNYPKVAAMTAAVGFSRLLKSLSLSLVEKGKRRSRWGLHHHVLYQPEEEEDCRIVVAMTQCDALERRRRCRRIHRFFFLSDWMRADGGIGGKKVGSDKKINYCVTRLCVWDTPSSHNAPSSALALPGHISSSFSPFRTFFFGELILVFFLEKKRFSSAYRSFHTCAFALSTEQLVPSFLQLDFTSLYCLTLFRFERRP